MYIVKPKTKTGAKETFNQSFGQISTAVLVTDHDRQIDRHSHSGGVVPTKKFKNTDLKNRCRKKILDA